jgi:hypothetical protein
VVLQKETGTEQRNIVLGKPQDVVVVLRLPRRQLTGRDTSDTLLAKERLDILDLPADAIIRDQRGGDRNARRLRADAKAGILVSSAASVRR